MLATDITYFTVTVTIFRNVLSSIYGTLCGPLEIPDGPSGLL